MKDKTKADGNQNGDGSTVDQIKSLIFGKEIISFNEQFKALEKQLNENKRLFDKKIQLLSEEIAGNLSNLDATIATKLKNNHTKLLKEIHKLDEEKVDRQKLREVLGKMVEEV